MYTEHDNGRGLVRCYWQDVRDGVMKTNPELAKLIDEVSPDKTLPLYKAYYPYGSVIADKRYSYLPREDGSLFKTTDPGVPKELVNELGYGVNGIPTGMVLDKTIEYFVNLEDESLTIPWFFYKFGDIFPKVGAFKIDEKNFTYPTNGTLTMTAGARSAFMLPNIGCMVHHANLQREFNLQLTPPKSLYEQWFVFKEILQSDVLDCDWHTCLLFFSEKWLDKIIDDPAWLEIRLYLLEIAWKFSGHIRYQKYYDIDFSLIQKHRNLKPNPYLADTVRHLFSTAIGAVPGYAPATDERALPVSLLQKAYVESYGMKRYLPTIMAPQMFNMHDKNAPTVYYSLQYPAAHSFSPKSRRASKTLIEMRELEHLMKIFTQELQKEDSHCYGMDITAAAKQVTFSYFHNRPDQHNIIELTDDLLKHDRKLGKEGIKYSSPWGVFAKDAPFLRGCISISPSTNE